MNLNASKGAILFLTKYLTIGSIIPGGYAVDFVN